MAPDITPEQLQSQIEQLSEFATQVQAQLQTTMTALQNSTQNAPPAVPVSPPKKTIKVATPDVFDGKLDKAETFLRQLLLYFHVKHDDFTDDWDKINFALSYMKGGTAGTWADQIVERYEEEAPMEIFDDWDDFKDKFRTTFADQDPASTARHKMDQIKQGSRTTDEYVAEFRELVPRTGYNDAAHVEKFEKGLNQSLVDRIYALPEMPTTLKEWIKWATKLDRQWRQREAKKKTAGNTSTSQRRFAPPILPGPTRPNKEPDVVPMDIDSGKDRRPPPICYKCRKVGHIARNCPSSVDVRNMDYESIKAIIKKELQDEGF